MKTTSLTLVASGCCLLWFVVAIALAIGLGIPLARYDSTTCQLLLEGSNNTMTEAQFRALAQTDGWPVTHPSSADCHCADPDDHPMYLAPTDLCSLFGLNATRADYDCSKTDANHVLVCVSTDKKMKLVEAGKCLTTRNTNETSVVGVPSLTQTCDSEDRVVDVNLAPNGRMICKHYDHYYWYCEHIGNVHLPNCGLPPSPPASHHPCFFPNC